MFTTVTLLQLRDSDTIRPLATEFHAGETAMAILCRLIAIGCLLVTFCADVQVGSSPREVVLPSPQLIHCRSVECSQLWKRTSPDKAAYPAQVLTDVVDGEVVGITAVYDKSVSTKELRSTIDTLYPKSAVLSSSQAPIPGLWRVQAEQLVIQLFERKDGAKLLIYLKILKPGDAGLVPSAHLNEPTE